LDEFDDDLEGDLEVERRILVAPAMECVATSNGERNQWFVSWT